MQARCNGLATPLNTAIRSMIAIKEEKDIDSLFTGGRTSALLNTITGIEDFELIAFSSRR